MELLRARIRAIVAATAVGALAALLVSSQLPTMYEGRASLIAQTMASTYAEVAKSRPVLEHVIATLGLTVTPEVLSQNVDARPSQTSALLTIVARDPLAPRAAAIANAIANRLVQMAPGISGSSAEAQQAIQDDLATVQDEIERAEATISELSAKPELTPDERVQLESQHAQFASLLSLRASLQSTVISYSQTVVTILAPAVPPTDPSSPKVVLASVVGGLAGLTIGLGIVLLPAYVRSQDPRKPLTPGTR